MPSAGRYPARRHEHGHGCCLVPGSRALPCWQRTAATSSALTPWKCRCTSPGSYPPVCFCGPGAAGGCRWCGSAARPGAVHRTGREDASLVDLGGTPGRQPEGRTDPAGRNVTHVMEHSRRRAQRAPGAPFPVACAAPGSQSVSYVPRHEPGTGLPGRGGKIRGRNRNDRRPGQGSPAAPFTCQELANGDFTRHSAEA
jgi:hypothetical protein